MLYLNAHIQSYSDSDIERLMKQLPEWRQEQALRFSHKEGRRECVLAYLELVRGLSEEFGIREPQAFHYNEHGKPSLADHPEIHFSLSHCRVAVGCLLSKSPCGLDIERLHPIRQSVVDYAMNEAERSQIAMADEREIAFLRLWTQKEAVLKLRGTGIAEGLREALHPTLLQGICLDTEEHAAEGFVLSTALALPDRMKQTET